MKSENTHLLRILGNQEVQICGDLTFLIAQTSHSKQRLVSRGILFPNLKKNLSHLSVWFYFVSQLENQQPTRLYLINTKI